MPLKDSEPLGWAKRATDWRSQQVEPAQEDIVTPIEAELQNEVERQFEHPTAHKKAIVSVNGEDVGEIRITVHDRAA